MAEETISPKSDLHSAIVELASSRAFSAATLAAMAASFLLLGGVDGSFGAILAISMAMIAATDYRSFIIPDVIVLLTIIAGFGAHLSSSFDLAPLLAAVIRGTMAAVAFQLLRLIYRWYRDREGMGFGDVKLAMAAGIWLDWFFLAAAIEIATLTALAIVFASAIIHRTGRPSAALAIPFGAYLAPSIWVAWIIQAKTTHFFL